MAARILVLFASFSIFLSCTKKGADGFQSLIKIEDLAASAACPGGGITVKSGIDKNRNGMLDANEVDGSYPVCNGQSSVADKQIILPINFSANVSNLQPAIGGELIKFNKLYYPGVDSIILIGNPYVGRSVNTAKVELYNLTDGAVIANSLLSTNNLYTERNFIETANLFNQLPDKEINLGIRLQTSINGEFAASGNCYLVLYRK
jgi:hypothetical protein